MGTYCPSDVQSNRILQASTDLTSGGWGYSFMDHTGGYYMATAILMALLHRRRSGEGQWVDLACIEAAGTLNGVASLDAEVNGRGMRRADMPNSNRSQSL